LDTMFTIAPFFIGRERKAKKIYPWGGKINAHL